MKPQIKELAMLLLPSPLSLFVNTLLSICVIVLANLAYVNHSEAISKYLFGYSDTNGLVNGGNFFSSFTNTLSKYPILNKSLLFIFWALVGLITYICLISLLRTFRSVEQDIEELSYFNVKRAQLFSELSSKWIIRIVASLGLIFNIFYFFKITLPYAISLTHTGLAKVGYASGWLYILYGALILFGVFQLTVILLRLLLLRIRLFD